MALIAEHFSQKHYGRTTSIANVGGQLGEIMTAILATIILPRFGWHILFLTGVFPVILAFFIRRNLKEGKDFIQNRQK